MSCEDCHSALSDHVKDDKVIGPMNVYRNEGIQSLCMMCHDRNNGKRMREPARTVDLRQHLQALRVTSKNRCEQCHHVHDPMKWVHEAREMVGVPEKMARIPMLEERRAVEKRRQYDSLAEIFFVFPLTPGFLGMTALAEEDAFPSQNLFIAGLVLVAGSYWMGKRAQTRELIRIRALNAERRATNIKVKEHNLRVEEAMNEYSQAITRWSLESEGRGIVNVVQR